MDYFSARDLIVFKHKADLAHAGLLCRVLPASGWKNALEQLQPAPVIFVWHQTDRVQSNEAGRRLSGKRQIVDQIWNSVLCVRNVSDIAGSAAQDDANALISVLLQLQGHKLSDDHGHCYRVQSNYQSAYVNGVGVFPFAFSTRIFT